MTYGFLAHNEQNQVLISSDLENLHYGGQATLTGTYSSGYGNFPDYSGSYDTLDGNCQHDFSFTTSGTPIVFLRPGDYSRFYAVLTHQQSGNNWTFRTIHSGTSSSPPQLHVFVVASNLPASAEQYGFQVFLDNGTTAFDSRLSPLSVQDGGVSQPPPDPTDSTGLPGVSNTGWNDATLDHDFRSTTRFNSATLSTSVAYTDLMFSAPSLAQAVYSRRKDGHKLSEGDAYSDDQHHYSTALWWVMYRSAFRLTSTTFDSGWATFAAGFHFSSAWEDGGWMGGGGGSLSYGTQPYESKTINLTDNAYILTDVGRYI
jgi:hypothetical protein